MATLNILSWLPVFKEVLVGDVEIECESLSIIDIWSSSVWNKMFPNCFGTVSSTCSSNLNFSEANYAKKKDDLLQRCAALLSLGV